MNKNKLEVQVKMNVLQKSFEINEHIHNVLGIKVYNWIG